MIIRVGTRAEPLEKLITDLESGSRQLSSEETARILRQMNEAIHDAILVASGTLKP